MKNSALALRQGIKSQAGVYNYASTPATPRRESKDNKEGSMKTIPESTPRKKKASSIPPYTGGIIIRSETPEDVRWK